MITDVLSEVNLTEGLQPIWVLVKNGDKEVDNPQAWFHQFEGFPMDEILGNIVPSLVESCISTKKFKALSQAVKKAVPKKKQTSKASSQEA